MDYPGVLSDYHGCPRHDFTVNGLKGILVEPRRARPGRPWYCRTRYFDAFPSVDVALLEKGWHIAWMDDERTYGVPAQLPKFDAFYRKMMELGLNRKVVLAGFSQGGLSSYSFAAAWPERTGCLYEDNPVCTIFCDTYWRQPPVVAGSFEPLQAALGMSREEAEHSYKGSPVDILEPLAKAKIPILHVISEADTVVNPEQNTRVLERRYRELGGEIEVIHKPGVDHHPHSLDDPTPIVEFIERHYPL